MKENWKIDNPLSCPIVSSLSLFNGKWKPMILHMLSSGELRFGELKRNIPPISQKVLTQQLKELVADNMVVRTEIPGNVLNVTYSMSSYGQTLLPILDALHSWGNNHQNRNASR